MYDKITIWPEAEYNKSKQEVKDLNLYEEGVDQEDGCMSCVNCFMQKFDLYMVCGIGGFRCYINNVCKHHKRKESYKWQCERLELK